MIVKMLTHIHMVVLAHFKGDEVGVDVDQLGDGTEVRRVQNSTGGVSARRVRTVRRCHRRPVQKRQDFTEYTEHWSHGDWTLSYVWSVAAVSVLSWSCDWTLARRVTGRSGPMSGQC